jgi:hypothetical protein
MTIKRRNQAARAAVMRKGGVHEKINKAKENCRIKKASQNI